MTISLLAKIALVLWLLYAISTHAEGLKPRGSAGLRVLGGALEGVAISVLLWAAWWS